jgi:hypothetical protein
MSTEGFQIGDEALLSPIIGEDRKPSFFLVPTKLPGPILEIPSIAIKGEIRVRVLTQTCGDKVTVQILNQGELWSGGFANVSLNQLHSIL